jgi:hypothetical protein
VGQQWWKSRRKAVESGVVIGGKWVRKRWKMGQQTKKRSFKCSQKVFQVLPNGLPKDVISYIKQSEFIFRNLLTVFLEQEPEVIDTS